MQKHQHAAHHWKQKVITPRVRIDPSYIVGNNDVFMPKAEPRITYNKQQGSWCVRFVDTSGESEKQKYVSKYMGKKFTTKEMAEAFKNKIWPQN